MHIPLPNLANERLAAELVEHTMVACTCWHANTGSPQRNR